MVTSAQAPRRVRIFVSSPGDVDEERRRMMEIIAGLNRRYAGFVDIQGVFWEQNVYPAHATFQAQIDAPASCDLMVCVLWTRLGSPLPTDWPPRPEPEGTPYESGTVYEFETALAARRAGQFPDIYVFRKLLPDDRAALDKLMEQHPAEKLRIIDYLIRRGDDDGRAAAQLLDAFWQRWFYSPDKGFIAAFNTFGTADEFAELSRQAIEAWLIGNGLVERLPDWDIAQRGSPYPGLAPFDESHAAVFFGRTRVTERASALLRGGAEAGFPWLLVTGPSGSGKSSLLRAGVVPVLTEETVLETWRIAMIRPGADDPLAIMLDTIAGPEVLGPSLAGGHYPDGADLARLARLSPAELARALVWALDRHAETVRLARRRNMAPQSRLLLVIDQMEEILLAAPDRQAEFGAALAALLAGGDGRIWIAATLRSDLQEPFLNLPAFQPLLTLEAGGSELKLAAPAPADMREVIEGPAARAGLSFEMRQGDGKSLAEELLASVGAASDALPLLQMTLELLFDRRDAVRGELRWADYEAIGRLEGAIASHAETILATLPPAAQDELGPLLRLLTRPWLSLDGAVELRPSELDMTRLSGDRETLARALIAGRLLVADEGGHIRVAHEAVLRNWARAEELLSADLDLARLKARLEPLALEWVAAGRRPADDARLLPTGAQLGAADAALRRYGAEELGEGLAAFIAASVAAEHRQRTRRQRVLAMVAGTFAVLAVLAVAGGIFAWHERGVATQALGDARKNFHVAVEQATGNIKLLENSFENGGISAVMLRELVDRADRALHDLAGQSTDIIAARVKLLDVMSLGNVTLGNIPAARKFVDQEETLIDGLSAKNPANIEWRKLWVTTRSRSASVRFWQGDIPGALAQARAVVEVGTALAAAFPDDSALHQDLTETYESYGDNLRAIGDIEDADKQYLSWLHEAETMAARQPDNLEWVVSLAFARQRLGDDLLVWDRPSEAAEQYRIYASIAKSLVAKDPGNGLFLEARTVSHQRLGDAWLALHRLAEAEAEYRRHLDTVNELVAVDPTNYRWRYIAETAHQRFGELRLQQQRPQEAETEFRIYVSMAEEVLRKDRSNNPALYDAANAYQEVGDALRAAGNLAGASGAYKQSLELSRELTARLATRPEWQRMAAIGYQRLGMVLRQQGDDVGALDHFRHCLEYPVKSTIWTPRALWPKDVTAYCRQEVARLAGTHPR